MDEGLRLAQATLIPVRRWALGRREFPNVLMQHETGHRPAASRVKLNWSANGYSPTYSCREATGSKIAFGSGAALPRGAR